MSAAARFNLHERVVLMPAGTVRYHNGHFHRGTDTRVLCDESTDCAPPESGEAQQ